MKKATSKGGVRVVQATDAEMITLPAQLALDLGHRPAFGHDEFLTAACNREAAAWVARWPDWPARTVVLCGPDGCGKTHLLSIWQRRARARMLTPGALPVIDPPSVVDANPAVAIDDVDRAFAGSGPGALLHLYNLVHEAQGWLLLTGRTPPSAWPISPPDLASRLRAAVVVPIHQPDDALLEAVLVKQFADRQLTVAPDVIRFLCNHLDRSFAAIRAAVAALDYASLAEKRIVSRQLATEVLALRNAAE